MAQTVSKEEAGHPGFNQQAFNLQNQGQAQFRAPLRSQNFSVTSPVTHPKSWYQALAPVTWNGGSQNITEPFTDVDGMMALVRRVYTDKTIPGFKYSEPRRSDIPYQTIQHGWNILGNQYNEDVEIYVGSGYIDIGSIRIKDGNGDVIKQWTVTSTTSSLPTGWTTTGDLRFENLTVNGSTRYFAYLRSGGYITIPASDLANETGYVDVDMTTYFSGSSEYTTTDYTLQAIGNETYKFVLDSAYSNGVYWSLPFHYPGSITTPPDDPGYTVMLVKLYDNFSGGVPEYTSSEAELKSYFSTYVKEIQLLTDGLRVNNDSPEAGTVFAYTGDLNRFYFIGKGKMAYSRSLDNYPFDRAPFYSMYEEFSPDVAGGFEDHDDFYEKMKQQQTYPVVHDCEGVIYLGHYFSMAGKQGTTENHVNSLVLYIPDNRGEYGLWQTYDPENQPTVGMYTIDLYADVEPSATQTDYYTVTVEWFDNLDKITHSDGIPQTYKLYEIRYNEETGENDTTLVYEGPLTEWSKDYPVGDPTYYDLHYYVIGTPTQATNQDTFFAKSNTDDVTIPGKTDFVGLQWWRYESDYVTNDGTNQEVNYYRNFLAPHALSVQGQAGINAGNVGTAGRKLTLYRDQTPIIDLELMMNGNKAYYRIKYINRDENQQVEPGYDANTGERTSTNN